MSKNNKQTEVILTERQQQELKEAKSVKRMTFTFVVIIFLCAAIFAGSLLAAPVQGIRNRVTKAITLGEHTLTGVELNYFYIDAISNYYQNYSSYLSWMGISASKPLDEQISNKTTGETYADYFLNMAIDNAKSTYALYDEAMRVGFKLSAEDQKTLDELITNLDKTIKYYRELYQSIGYSYNYKGANDYLKGIYGNGASGKSYQSYYEVCMIADAYYAEYYDGLEYTDADLRAYEKDKMSDFTSYTYNYYQFSVSTFLEGGTKSEDGKTTTYSDEEKEAARLVAKGLADKLAEGTYATLEEFDNALDALLKEYEASKKTETSAEDATNTTGTTAPEGTDATNPSEPEGTTPDDGKTEEDDKKEETNDKKKTKSTLAEDKLGTAVNSLFLDWIKDEARKEGDMTVIENATGEGDSKTVNGYYIVRFTEADDNTFALVDVRHILVKFEGGTYNSSTGATTYSDAEKKKAKEAAEKLLEEWKAGKADEDSFAELANKESDDNNGKVTNGGIYEDIYPGQMVTNFNDWCFDKERKVGDTGIVETEYGYHVMYFSAFSETNYRDYMIENTIRNEDVNEWHEALIKAIACTLLTDKCIDKGITMSEVAGA